MRKHDFRRGFEIKEHEKRLEQAESEIKKTEKSKREKQGDTYPEGLMTEETNVVSSTRRRLNEQKKFRRGVRENETKSYREREREKRREGPNGYSARLFCEWGTFLFI